MLILGQGRLSTLSGHCAVQEPDIQPGSTRGVQLLNDLISAQQHRLRDRDANLSRRFQIYD